MGIYIPPQGDITVNESAIKNTDAEIRDGVWADSTKADGANISSIYGNTSTLIHNTSLILVMGSNDATLANQSTILQYNQSIDAVVDAVKTITDVLPDSGALTSLGTVINQSLILIDGDSLLANTSSIIESNATIDSVVDLNLANLSTVLGQNATIDTVVDAIQAVTDLIPNSGAMSSIATLANQSLIEIDGDNIIANTSSLIQTNATIDHVVDTIQAVTDVLPDSGAMTSIASIVNQSLVLVDGDNLLANTSSLIASNATIDTILDRLPDDGNLTSLGNMANQTHFRIENAHYSYVFPENTGYTLTMHTGAANTYGPYNMILDDQNNTFSDKFNNTEGHITSMLIEDASALDKTFQYEISYGAEHTALIEYRFHSMTNQIGPTSQTRVRPPTNPAGEVLYYRGMCENESANAEVSFRYHFH